MITAELLENLKYTDSPNFLRADQPDRFDFARDFGHIFRRARKDLGLKGVYALRERVDGGRETLVPLVYVCEIKDDEAATEVHRLVWNQNVVPLLILISPKAIRVYPGFQFDRSRTTTPLEGAIGIATDLTQALALLEGLKAPQIDSGEVWDHWGTHVTPDRRVDWRLLDSLGELDAWLLRNGVDLDVSHALIGKFVYLHYLRQREILSDKKLDEWNIKAAQLFSRNATAPAFWTVLDKLDDWLNGSTFPLPSSARKRITQQHIQKVAATFAGDDPGSGQLALDFSVYDFSIIPIETLSVIYEQFLHALRPGQHSLGKASGAYYTPVPLVNFMLEELDELHPFQHGFRVLDPACGSGAFLVQCYRRIVEHDEEFDPSKSMRPARLRELLEQHVFGIDRDADACRVAELSLTLTLLDYVDPPDLRRTPTFRLPTLSETNIFHGDFFDPNAAWRELLKEPFDWIVGNPPWIEVGKAKANGPDRHVHAWITENRRTHPVGGNQVAEAFSWKANEHVRSNGHVALLLPAMTLFKDESSRFRTLFFQANDVRLVSNFANLAYVLFPGHKKRDGGRRKEARPQRPAAAFFYRPATLDSQVADPATVVFSPMVAEQVASRPSKAGTRIDSWNILVEANQLTELRQSDIIGGEALPWKIALWGSHLDGRLLRSLSSRFESFKSFCDSHGLKAAKGFEIRHRSASEKLNSVPELHDKPRLDNSKIKTDRLLFEFPKPAFSRVPKDWCFARKGRTVRPLEVSKPPHIIVDKLRRYAVYSDEFIIVPAGQIGISGPKAQGPLLEALSLFLISDFVFYHQFFLSPEWGVSTSISSLEALRLLPVPLGELSQRDLREWSALRGKLVAASRHENATLLSNGRRNESVKALMQHLNERVFELLQLSSEEGALIEDLVHLRVKMIKGKVTKDIQRKPGTDEIKRYASFLQIELNAFIGDEQEYVHDVSVLRDTRAAMVAVSLQKARRAQVPVIVDLNGSTASTLERAFHTLIHDHRQWVYFQRNLRIYKDSCVYLLKPLECLHWTRTQAMLDAGAIIAETLD